MRKYERPMVYYSCDRVMYGIHMFSAFQPHLQGSRSFSPRGKDEKSNGGRRWGEVRWM